MLFYATLFDSNYLSKGLALYSSLVSHLSSDFKLFVLCLDETTFDYLVNAKYKSIHPIPLSELEKNDEKLMTAKNNRGKVEYYFTLSPVLPLYILSNFSDVDFITTLDADVFFFNDPKPIYDSFKGKSILITPHRFPQGLKEKEKYGLYNVSFQIFRNDIQGLECLRTWRDQCIEWCYDKLEGNKFADQKYLDEWAKKFPGLKVLDHEGAGLAPWNIDSHKITKIGETIYSNNSPLIFYHFHYLKIIRSHWFSHGVDLYFNKMTKSLKNIVYHPYINKLIDLDSQLKITASNHHLRINSAPKLNHPKEVLRSFSTLYNIFSFYTIEINLKKYFRLSKKFLKV